MDRCKDFEEYVRADCSRLIAAQSAPSLVLLYRIDGKRSKLAMGTVPISSEGSDETVPDDGTVYDIASLTKVVCTWAVAGVLVSRGLLALDDEIGEHIEYAGPGQHVTVRQILTHTSGLISATWLKQYGPDPSSVWARMVEEPLSTTEGRAEYINRGFILLGKLLENVGGEPLSDLARTLIWDPLGMASTSFGPTPNPRCGYPIAPTEHFEGAERRTHGTVHDENAAFLGGVAGHAGVFTTASDLAVFAEAFLDGNLAELVGRDWIQSASDPQVEWKDGSYFRTLGWACRVVGSKSLVYHDGFTGVSLFMDSDSGNYVVLLSNSVYFERRSDNLQSLRHRIMDFLLSVPRSI